VDGLLKWWTARYGIVPGSRNANLYKLAAAFNNYGIAQAEALEVCLRYSDPTSADPLTAREITATVASAYRRTEHGVKHWTPGKKERPTPTPTPPRVLTDAQARAIEDRLVAMMQSRWPTVNAPTPLPIANPAVIAPSKALSAAECLMQRIAERNPAINTFVASVDLDMSVARIIRFPAPSGVKA
jgi:hypothetical protein